ncbi:MAG: hypothetical protein IPG76_21890 [Acidobacteria bacterium]|nr:hypothetical protein [Acidobacteriota bacterium]
MSGRRGSMKFHHTTNDRIRNRRSRRADDDTRRPALSFGMCAFPRSTAQDGGISRNRAPFSIHAGRISVENPAQSEAPRLNGKFILKRAMRDKLPPSVIKRPKKGFGMPVAKWIKGDLRQLVRDTLSPRRLKDRGLFNPEYVIKMLDEHEKNQADHRKLIWTLLMFELWPLGE